MAETIKGINVVIGSETTALTAAFGAHVVQCEPDQILSHYLTVDETAVAQKEQDILGFFDTPDPVSDPLTTRLTAPDLRKAAAAAVALDRFIAGSYAGGYEAGLIAEFDRLLPDAPPWKRSLATEATLR